MDLYRFYCSIQYDFNDNVVANFEEAFEESYTNEQNRGAQHTVGIRLSPGKNVASPTRDLSVLN